MTFSPTVPCEECGGFILVGQFAPITVPLQDDEGFPVLDERGFAQKITLRLPLHRYRLVGPVEDLTVIPPIRSAPEEQPSVFDPLGLAGTYCEHGLKEHPLGFPLQYGAKSWVRARYVTYEWMCVVDLGQERPADLTEKLP